MDIVGLVAEYNPFHNGHLLQLREIRRRFPDAGIVVAMSGSLTQRGSVAVLDKWKRAEAAVRHGVSLVLELPALFATRSAQYFAGGGVRLLDRLGVARVLAFGAECDNLKTLSRLAEETGTTESAEQLRKKMRDGGSYAAALTGTAGPEAAIRQPNVILAVEYLRAIARHGASLIPAPLPRFTAAHHDLSLPPDADGAPLVASASAIRSALFAKAECAHALRAVPADVAAMLSGDVSDTSRLLRPMLARLLMASPDEISAVAGVGEGLEHRLHRAALDTCSYDELVDAVRAKRYPRARIRRILLHLLPGL
ncbi:MAG: nucleotidyltransferase family protein, partial [Schwartzia sp.]|nr:nucleotidyltransferase family protein [Schwartzia sp. (in: firmicutes)]